MSNGSPVPVPTSAPESPAEAPPTLDTRPVENLVCIGASAGGLDALERFFAACPTDTGATYVVIQHLSPDHKSMMGNLLARHTRMPVTMVEHDTAMRRDQVYLIPPGSVMHCLPGWLHLTPKNPRGLTLPIDIFLASAAETYGARASAIILSGTGSDGTRGIQDLHAAGGFILAQEPESAKFDGMPRSAIATGHVAATMPPEDMPRRLLQHWRNEPPELPRADVAAAPGTAALTPQEALAAILRLLHQHCGIDFEEYKSATVNRRIERRLQVRHCSGLPDYLRLLEREPGELMNLRREMLIPVTSFFRDPEAFDALAEEVIQPLVAQRDGGDTIRVWVAGVATGEEAYTVAMLFLEAFERQRRWPALKIFATDADQPCIDTAGMGQYPESSALELTPTRLARFFIRQGERYAVKTELRQCIVFARHNLLADPPFTKMDLVLCRNALIYFKNTAQERVLQGLHYALNTGGAMMLGSSESIAPGSDGLQVINARHKLFRCIAPMGLPLGLQRGGLVAGGVPSVGARGNPGKPRRRQQEQAVGDEGAAALLQLYAPPAILVNASHEVVHLYGQAQHYLTPRPGTATLEVARLLPDPLMPVASALLYKVGQDRASLNSDPVEVQRADGQTRRVRLSAHPLPGDQDTPMMLLCFEEVGAVQPVATGGAIDVDAETVARVAALERELRATRESLQATIEELETSNEELQATNEELMASNEELQSSNEELQSVNEEMGTVNAEFQEKMILLNRLNADLDNMAKAAGVATVFVDDALQITRFSPDATSIFKLREGDVGRRLDDITHTLDDPRLMEDIASTLRGGRMIEREARSVAGDRIYLLRVLPYVIQSSMRPGAVVTLVDISELHNAQRLQSILDALPEHVAVLDPTGVILAVNAAWTRFALANGGVQGSALGVGSHYLEACAGGEDESAQRAARGIRAVLGGELATFSLEYPCHSPTEERWFVMNVAPVRRPGMGAVVSHFNISAWRRDGR